MIVKLAVWSAIPEALHNIRLLADIEAEAKLYEAVFDSSIWPEPVKDPDSDATACDPSTEPVNLALSILIFCCRFYYKYVFYLCIIMLPEKFTAKSTLTELLSIETILSGIICSLFTAL